MASFADASERRERFAQMMAPLGNLNWGFHDVVPAEGLPVPYDDITAYQIGGSVLSPAERSCAASHLTMMVQFLESDDDYLMAVEDDVLFDPTVRFQAHVQVMKACGLDFYKLYARFFSPAVYVRAIGRTVFYRASWPTLGTQCYIVSRRGAQVLLDHAASNGGLTAPIDDTNDAFWDTGLPIVFPYPFPVMEIGGTSSIHAARPDIVRRNAELAKEMGGPTRFDRIKKQVNRKLADRALKRFDAQLKQSLTDHRKDLVDAFYR
ncbi:MAG: glycosyltransferase family 25 protein [Pseudomonadota bacterium]